MAAIPGRRAELWVQSGAAQSFTSEACQLVSGTTYEVTDADKRNWSPTSTITVYVDGSPLLSGYTLQRPVGRIVFDEAPGGTVTATGQYLPVSKVGFVRSWELSIANETLETSSLGDTSRSFVTQGLPTWEISLDKLLEDDTWPALAMDNADSGQHMLVKLYEDRSGSNRLVWAGYATVTSDKETVPISDLIGESITLTGEGMPYYVDETD